MAKSKELWDFLKRSGVLDHGTPEDIEKAKQEYRKQYLREYRRHRRKQIKEVTVSFRLSNYSKLQQLAKEQGKSISGFIKDCVICELGDNGKLNLSKDEKEHLVNIEVFLSMIYSELEYLANQDIGQTSWQNPELKILQEKIGHIEALVKAL